MAVFLLLALGLARLHAYVSERLTPQLARNAVTAVAAAAIAGYSSLTLAQSSVWSDTRTLSAYVVAASPSARLGHLWYGNALRDDGQIDKALMQYHAALSMKEDPQVLYNRALAFEFDRQTAAATADYERALVLDPRYALAHINLGRLQYLAGNKDNAQTHFEAALKLAPQLAMPAFNLGVLEGERKNWERAAEYYREALERDPLLNDARANLAIALLNLKRTPEAVEELKTTLMQDPENPTARAAMEKLLREGVVKSGE
jgi:tetratricopeptide (TPR) repeat protein